MSLKEDRIIKTDRYQDITIKGIVEHPLVVEQRDSYFKDNGDSWFVTMHEGAMWATMEDFPDPDKGFFEEFFMKTLEEFLTHPKEHDKSIKIVDLFGFKYAVITGQFFVDFMVKHSHYRYHLIFHAIRFPDGRQWDAYSGWRTRKQIED